MFLCQSLPRLTDKPHTKMQYIQVTMVLPQWPSLLEHPVIELYCTHYSSWLVGAQKSRYSLDLCRYRIYMCKLIWCSFMFNNNDKRERERALVLHTAFSWECYLIFSSIPDLLLHFWLHPFRPQFSLYLGNATELRMEIWQQRSSVWCCNGGICVLSNAEMAQSRSI